MLRDDLVPREDKITTMKPHHYCQSTDLNEMETDFMKSELYQLLHKSKFMRRMNRPSPVDGDLDGMYCTRYNNAVRANPVFGKNAFRPTLRPKRKPRKNFNFGQVCVSAQ